MFESFFDRLRMVLESFEGRSGDGFAELFGPMLMIFSVGMDSFSIAFYSMLTLFDLFLEALQGA